MTTKQIEDVRYKTIYVAADGTEFDDRDTCETYDRSFACVMRSRLKAISISTSTEEDIFYTGSCENEVFVVIPKTLSDIDCIKQFAYALGTGEERVSKWIDDSDINKPILVTIGYNNEWIYVSRLETIVKNAVGDKFVLQSV